MGSLHEQDCVRPQKDDLLPPELMDGYQTEIPEWAIVGTRW
jgi:hypothetical protein